MSFQLFILVHKSFTFPTCFMQLKKQVILLTQQIDYAQFEVEDLRQVVNNESPADERPVKIWVCVDY